MKVETVQHNGLAPLLLSLKKLGSWAAAILYFLAAHIYDGLCCAVSNLYPYPVALGIMTAVLFSISTALVILHDQLRKFFQWDILGINEINRLAMIDHLEPHKISQRLTLWILRQGHWWIHIIGSALIGPPVVTLLLRKDESWKSNLVYLTSGTLISVLVWVTAWTGIGQLIWNRLIRPWVHTVMHSWV